MFATINDDPLLHRYGQTGYISDARPDGTLVLRFESVQCSDKHSNSRQKLMRGNCSAVAYVNVGDVAKITQH